MATARFIASDGSKGSDMELSADLFDAQVNVPILYGVIRSQLAAGRSGTHSTKTRAEVRGGGAKPWMQKGTGRARHGSIREPSWVGGGIAHGPKPRDYSMRINKKEKVLALKSALTARARDGKVVVIEVPQFEEPETKRAIQLLEDWGTAGKTLIVVAPDQEEQHANVWKSFRNLPQVLAVTYPTAYTVLAADTVVFTKEALDLLSASTSKSASSETSARSIAEDGEAPVSPTVPLEGEQGAEQAAGESERDESSAEPLEAERSVEPPAGSEESAGSEQKAAGDQS